MCAVVESAMNVRVKLMEGCSCLSPSLLGISVLCSSEDGDVPYFNCAFTHLFFQSQWVLFHALGSKTATYTLRILCPFNESMPLLLSNMLISGNIPCSEVCFVLQYYLTDFKCALQKKSKFPSWIWWHVPVIPEL